MPVQPSNPLPGLASLMDQLDERARAIEAKRVFYGCAVASDLAISGGGSGSIPGAFLNIFTGGTGLCVVFAEGAPDLAAGTGGSMILTVSINGGAYSNLSGSSNSVSDHQGGILVKGSAGFVLTPYTYNTFQLGWNDGATGSYTIHYPSIAVLPI